MKHKYFFKLFLFLVSISTMSFSQSAGDIAFIAYNGDTADEFAFVTLIDFPANTSIWFTDNEWDGTDRFNNINEGEVEWTHTSILPAGSVVVIAGNSGGAASITSGLGTVSGSGINLGASNETLYALLSQPVASSAMASPGFLAGIANDLSGDGVGVLTNTGLTDGTNFIDFDNDHDGFKFIGNRYGQTSFSNYLSIIMNKDNWQDETSDGTLILPISSTSFSIINATWDGSTDNDWDTAANWTPASVPTSTSDVLIPNGLTNYPTTAASAISVIGITIESGATLDTQNATSFSGNVTYKRSLGTTNWYLVSSPVNGEDMTDMRANNSFKTNGSSEVSFAPYDNTQAVANDRWAYYASTATDALVNGKGYSTSLSATGDITFSGTINISGVTIALTQGGGSGTNFNLLGNPFTAYINSGTFLTNESGDLASQTIWLWDQSGNGGAGEYVTKVTADAFKVAPGQGFFVEASSTNDVTFTEAMQSHESSDTFQRNGRKEVHIHMNDGTNNKFAKLYYIDGTSTGFDNGYDGELFGGVSNPFAIYTHLLSDSQGKNYQVQSLPSSDYENMIVPVGVNAVAGKELTFSANAMNLPSGINVFLEDKLTNTFTRLDETNSEYKVTLNNDLNGIGRFYVHTSSQVLNTPNFDLNSVRIYKTSKTNVRVTGLQSGNTTMNLYNILGKKVHSNSFIAKSVNDINLPVLNTGVYIVQLRTEQGKINKKIIIE